MSSEDRIQNLVRNYRQQRDWSQEELAQRAGISRTAVSAIEGERLVPSVATAISLARVFGCSVEELFGVPSSEKLTAEWAWKPSHDPCRYWHARVGNRKLLYPVEVTAAGEVGHDGVFRNGQMQEASHSEAEKTLLMACCDPAAGILASAYAQSGFRMIVLPRSSRDALSLLKDETVHVAGIHLSSADDAGGNSKAVRERLGPGFELLRVAEWQEGLAIAPTAGVNSVASALKSKLTWIGRDAGSGARQCLDELLPSHRAPRRLARDHRGVAEAVRSGWADIGVCLRLVSEESNLKFLSLRWESYDLCFATSNANDPRIKALVATVRSPQLRQLVGDLPGYDVRSIGTCHTA